MKFRFVKYLSVVILAAFALVGCENGSDDNGGEDIAIRLSVFPESITVDYEAQTSFIAVTTNATEWDFVSAISWVEASRNGDDINLVISQNYSENTREGEIIIFATSGSQRVEKKVLVKQFSKEESENGNNDDFECPVFESLMLSSYDSNGDGRISETEAARVTEIDVTFTESDAEEREYITSLKGIKRFKNLKYLYCDNNLILDLDLSGMEKLELVDCYYNDMVSLNVSNCPSLKWVYCYSNNLTDVNISGSNNLVIFQAYQNKLKTLDVSGLKELVYFDVRLNNLRDVEFSNCPKLQVAAIGANNLISLNLEGLPSLYTLGCYENNIASLDLSANTKLTALTCQRNMLTSLNIENCKLLAKIDCSNNFLEGAADFSKFTALKRLYCGGNRYTSISVNACSLLEELSCENTQITALEVSSLSLLTSLVANDCLISKMNCSNNLKLNTLHLQGNPLTELVLAQGQSIADLKVDNYDVISYQ